MDTNEKNIVEYCETNMDHLSRAMLNLTGSTAGEIATNRWKKLKKERDKILKKYNLPTE